MDLGMTVGMLRATMGQREFVRWKVFYDLRDRATAEAVEASASKQQ